MLSRMLKQLKSLSLTDTTRLSKIDTLIAVCLLGIILSGLAFLAEVNHQKPPVVRGVPVIVKETGDISFQREGEMVLATFTDGTICIHDKRERPICHRAIPNLEVK
jgi:hypothetical protein